MDNTYSVNKNTPKKAKKYRISPALEGIILGIFALLLTFITAYFIYINSMDVLQKEIKDGLLRTVSGIAACLDGDLIETFKEPKDANRQDYKDMIVLMQKARIGTKHISYLYISIVKKEKCKVNGKEEVVDKAYMIVDPISLDEDGKPLYTDAASLEPSIPMTPYKDADEFLIRSFNEGKAVVADKAYTDRWGTFYSAYAPIFNSNKKIVGTLGADLRIAELDSRCKPMVDATKRAFIVSVSLAILLGTFVWFTRRFTFLLNESRQTIFQNFLVAKRFADQTSTSIGSQFRNTSSILRYTAQKLDDLIKIDNQDSVKESLILEREKINKFADRLLTLGELKYSKREKELENFSILEVNNNILAELKNDEHLADKVNRISYDIDKDLPEILYGPVISYEELIGHFYELCLNHFNSPVYSKTIMIEERNKDVIVRQTFAVSTEGLNDKEINLAQSISKNITSEDWGQQLELSESINIPIIHELLYILGSTINAEIKDDFFKINFEFILLKSQEEDDVNETEA